jgi:type II secretory pathway pseudopilin PulG
MNLSRPYHKIYGVRFNSGSATFRRLQSPDHHDEAGYALVAMLAVMTVLALFALAAAPSVRQQSQREQEKEAIFRGEQVAEAIRLYYLNRRATMGVTSDQALPTSIDQLLEGVPIPGGAKKRQILRVSAARDPLSESGEWGFVRPRSQKLIDFQRSIILYANNVLPTPRSREMVELQGFMAPQITSVLGVDSKDSGLKGEDFSDDSTGPFIGVVSRSKKDAVLYYYGIEQHDEWVFTPLFK